MNQHTKMQMTVAPQKPMESSIAPTTRTPPVRYTGGPGTGGRRNMLTPRMKKQTITTPGLRSFMIEIMYPRKSTAPLPTPTSHTK